MLDIEVGHISHRISDILYIELYYNLNIERENILHKDPAHIPRKEQGNPDKQNVH